VVEIAEALIAARSIPSTTCREGVLERYLLHRTTAAYVRAYETLAANDPIRQASYLGALFRRETGLSVRQFLTRVRLDRASTLIREGVKIEAAALLVGYRSKKNFYRQFKRRFAMTPFAYGAAVGGGSRRGSLSLTICRTPSASTTAMLASPVPVSSTTI